MGWWKWAENVAMLFANQKSANQKSANQKSANQKSANQNLSFDVG
jgi:hypothetical protein